MDTGSPAPSPKVVLFHHRGSIICLVIWHQISWKELLELLKYINVVISVNIFCISDFVKHISTLSGILKMWEIGQTSAATVNWKASLYSELVRWQINEGNTGVHCEVELRLQINGPWTRHPIWGQGAAVYQSRLALMLSQQQALFWSGKPAAWEALGTGWHLNPRGRSCP